MHTRGQHEPEPGRGEEPGGVFVLTREQLRELDTLAEREFGIPSIVLMENAAIHAADLALETLGEIADCRVLIVCGPGKNGGDGLAVARHLHNASIDVRVVMCGEVGAMPRDAATNAEIVRRMGLAYEHANEQTLGDAVERATSEFAPDMVIDALMGTGLSRPLAGGFAAAVEAMNAAGDRGVPILSLDCPSGMDVNTGGCEGPCVRANLTVTFAGLKPGFLSLEAQEYLGEVVVGDIGAPRELLARLGARLVSGHLETLAEEHVDSPVGDAGHRKGERDEDQDEDGGLARRRRA